MHIQKPVRRFYAVEPPRPQSRGFNLSILASTIFSGLAFATVATVTVAISGAALAQPVRARIDGPAGPVTAAELVESRGMCCLAVSPDGLRVAARVSWQEIATNSTHAKWIILDIGSGRTVGEADAGETLFDENGAPALEMPQWSVDSAWLYFRALKGEEVQVWRVRPDGSRRQQVTREAANIEAFIVGANGAVSYAVTGATRAEIKAAEAAELDTGVLLDGSVVPGPSITNGFPVNGRMATYRRVRRPEPLAQSYGELGGDRPIRFLTLDAPGARSRPAGEGVAAQFNAIRKSLHIPMFDPVSFTKTWSHDHKGRVGLLAAAPKNTEIGPSPRSGQVLGIEDLASGQIAGRCADPVCTDADQLLIAGWTHDDRSVIFQTVTFGRYGLHIWEVESGRVATLASQDAGLGTVGNGTVGACSVASLDIVCVSSGAATAPRLVAIALKDHRQRVLFDPNPTLVPSRLGQPEKIELKTKAGDLSYGWLVLPPGAAPNRRLPLVISSYSCSGFLLGGSGHDVPEHVLAGMGYAAICVDTSASAVRRQPGSGWSERETQALQMDLFEDAVAVLDRRGLIDPGRVVLAGFSGSATAITAGLAQTDRFTAAIIGTGTGNDPIGCYLQGRLDFCRSQAQQAGNTPPYDLRTGFFADSPAFNANKIFTPLLMEVSEAEHGTLMQLFTSLVDFDRSVEMHIYPRAYHYKNLPRQRLSVYTRNIDWISFWLRDETAADPGKQAAFDRWTAMRRKQCQLFSARDDAPRSAWYCR